MLNYRNILETSWRKVSHSALAKHRTINEDLQLKSIGFVKNYTLKDNLKASHYFCNLS